MCSAAITRWPVERIKPKTNLCTLSRHDLAMQLLPSADQPCRCRPVELHAGQRWQGHDSSCAQRNHPAVTHSCVLTQQAPDARQSGRRTRKPNISRVGPLCQGSQPRGRTLLRYCYRPQQPGQRPAGSRAGISCPYQLGCSSHGQAVCILHCCCVQLVSRADAQPAMQALPC